MSLGDKSWAPWIPTITYEDCGTPNSFTLALPQFPWTYRSHAQGGRDVAASGVTESFVIRHDRIYDLRLRCTEEEWVESVEPWLAVVMAQEQAFTLQLDQDDSNTEHTVRLVRPVTGEEFGPEPNPYSGVLEFQVAVRTDDGSALSYPYFRSLA